MCCVWVGGFGRGGWCSWSAPRKVAGDSHVGGPHRDHPHASGGSREPWYGAAKLETVGHFCNWGGETATPKGFQNSEVFSDASKHRPKPEFFFGPLFLFIISPLAFPSLWLRIQGFFPVCHYTVEGPHSVAAPMSLSGHSVISSGQVGQSSPLTSC